MAGLTAKQKGELNQAIHEYLLKNQFPDSAEIFAQEANLPETSTAITTRLNGSTAVQDILEKKWTSVVKMKKQVMDLEKQLKQYKEGSICERCGNGAGGLDGLAGLKQGGIGDGLPRTDVPAKFSL